jgi:hypothetical protein
VESFRFFDLQFDWMLLADGNSGVKYLIQRVDEWVNQAGRRGISPAQFYTNTVNVDSVRCTGR